MNWGHKITIVIVVFLVAMVSMVIVAYRQTNDMIDENYYTKELEYQKIIDARRNLLKVSDNNLISQGPDIVLVHLPVGTYEKLESGTIEFLRPDDKSKDVFTALEWTGHNRIEIPKSQLHRGMYRARIKWSSGGIPFYKEETLFVE
jgi:hypothetical protein